MGIDAFHIAGETDAGTITRLVNDAYRPGSGIAGWTHEADWVSGDRTNIIQIRGILSKANSTILLGIKDSRTVACIHVEKDGDTCHIGMLAVDPALQGSGLGKQILNQAENFAITHFGSTLFSMAVVSTRSELIAFYSRRGYRKTGHVMEYPLLAQAGIPKCEGLTIEILEKRPDDSLARNT